MIAAFSSIHGLCGIFQRYMLLLTKMPVTNKDESGENDNPEIVFFPPN
jgi:hypothetical protein